MHPNRTLQVYSVLCDRCGTEPVVMTQGWAGAAQRSSNPSVPHSQGLIRVKWTTEIQKGSELWRLTFDIEFGKRSHKVFVTARKQGSRRVLRMPQDRDYIVRLLDYDMWPEFAQSFFTKGEGSSQQEGLFES